MPANSRWDLIRRLRVKFSNVMFSLLFTCDDLVFLALVWLPMIRYRAIQFGTV